MAIHIGVATGSGSDTLIYRWDTQGMKLVKIRIFDDTGKEWTEQS